MTHAIRWNRLWGPGFWEPEGTELSPAQRQLQGSPFPIRPQDALAGPSSLTHQQPARFL